MWRLALLAVVCGCGGSGGSGTQDVVGAFSGPWRAMNSKFVPPPGEEGSLSLTLGADGDVTGTCFNEGKNETGVVSGRIVNGVFNLAVDYPTVTDWTITGPVPRDGQDIRGNVYVNTEEYNRTVHVFYTYIDLVRQ
jgi:hypothetical protein